MRGRTCTILGISCYYHDSAATIIRDGEIIAAAQEERFTRIKHDSSFPTESIKFCLESVKLDLSEIHYVIFYEKPFIKFERLLETYLEYVPRGFSSFARALPIWIKNKLFTKQNIIKELKKIAHKKDNNKLPNLLFSDHHKSHAASAFFPSPFEEALILTLDGVGEWDTSSIWVGKKNTIKKIRSLEFPHSLGLLYSAFTYYAGFKVNSGEYKLMGLAPYGNATYVNDIKNNLIDIKDDGSFRLDMSYFDFATGLKMTSKKFDNLFGGKPRKPETEITQKEMDLAKSIQVVLEEIVLKILDKLYEEFEINNLCLAGGVALNCVLNGKIVNKGKFKNIWIQPAAGDAGGSLGASLLAWYEYLGKKREISNKDKMKYSYLGNKYSNEEIKNYLDLVGANYRELTEKEIFKRVALEIKNDSVVGWFQGRMEFGPRALGNRSIIGSPLNKDMQHLMNIKIKNRESFRPFAPVIKYEKLTDWFKLNIESPYMLIVSEVTDEKKVNIINNKNISGFKKLSIKISKIPAVTHVDYSARIQTVTKDQNYKLHSLLSHFEEITDCPILVNTSFNVRGEPIVCNPKEAYECFMKTGMNILVLENIFLDKLWQNSSKIESFKKDYSNINPD